MDKFLQLWLPALITKEPTSKLAKALYKMEGNLRSNLPTIQLEAQAEFSPVSGQTELVSEVEEKLAHINSSYTLNDYLLPRGLPISMYQVLELKILKVSWPMGTTSKLKPIKTWLTGLMVVAVLSQTTRANVKSRLIGQTAKVATGISYLGTMSNGLATTGVDGLEVIIVKQVFPLGTTTIGKMVWWLAQVVIQVRFWLTCWIDFSRNL